MPHRPVLAESGRTYYFTLAATTTRKVSRILGLGLIPAIAADRIGGTGPVAITPIDDNMAKIKIRELLSAGK